MSASSRMLARTAASCVGSSASTRSSTSCAASVRPERASASDSLTSTA